MGKYYISWVNIEYNYKLNCVFAKWPSNLLLQALPSLLSIPQDILSEVTKGTDVITYYNESQEINITVALMLPTYDQIVVEGVDMKNGIHWSSTVPLNITRNVEIFAETTLRANLANCSLALAGLILFGTGILGLVSKVKTIENKAIKLVKCTNSVWCIAVGLLVAATKISNFVHGYRKEEYSSVATTFSFVVGILAKISFVSYKQNAVLVYIFQNVMIFRPFFFREYRRALTNILSVCVMLQWILTYCILYAWVVFVVFSTENCSGYDVQAVQWRKAVFLLSIVACMLSFGLSSVYLFGFYKENVTSNAEMNFNDHEKERRADVIRQTVLSCGLEVISNISLVIYISATMTNCFKEAILASHPFLIYVEKMGFINENGVFVKHDVMCDHFTIGLENLYRDSCAFFTLIVSQPLLQELFLLVSRSNCRCFRKIQMAAT